MVNFPTWIRDCDSYSLALWISFFLLMLVFVLQLLPLLGNSDHGVVSFPLIFHQIHNRMPRFIALAYGYSHIDWHSLHDHLRDIQ